MYTQKEKEAILKKYHSSKNPNITNLAKEEGIDKSTLKAWLRKEKEQIDVEAQVMPHHTSSPTEKSAEEKFHIVVETMAMNQLELSEYARKKGVFVSEIEEWKEACLHANSKKETLQKEEKSVLKKIEREKQQLEKELQRKEKALVEAAALLMLQKKVQAIWGEQEGE